MTDHTAIVERMAVQLAKDAGEPDWPSLCERDKRYWRTRAQAALTASGLLEVLEKAEGAVNAFPGYTVTHQFSSGGDGGSQDTLNRGAALDALRNAIKGVRDGK